MTLPDNTVPVTSTKQLIPDGLAGYAKAIVAFVVSLLGALLVVLPADGDLSDLTLTQWFGVAITVLGTTGGVYGIPNAARGTKRA
jgi:hypothetical protein